MARGDPPFAWSQWLETAGKVAGKPTRYFYRLILDLWERGQANEANIDDSITAKLSAIRKELDELTTDFFLEVAKGNVAGHASINKFGLNGVIASGVTADIWSHGQTGGVLVWVAPTAARTHTIASTDADDTTGGAGARTVKVYGLTDWDTAEVSETVTMNTASPPVTTNSYVIIHRMKVVTSGGTVAAQVNQGTITATATGDATVTAQIEVGNGQTEMAIYGVPSVETLYITSLGYSMNKAGGNAGLIDVDLLVNSEPDSQLTSFVHKQHMGFQTVGTSTYSHHYSPPKAIAGPAIVKMQAVSGTNSISVSGWFDAVRVTNGF